ncbi:MAG: GNAT family N-acetyltransferase [Comamonadaceae bacterium]
MNNPIDGLRICRADYGCQSHSLALVTLLDVYARDPMGGGEALSDFARTHLVRSLAERPQAFSVLAFMGAEDDTPVGLVNCIEGFSTFACRALVNIHDVVVLPAFRGQRIAQQMLALVDCIARERGACKLTLEVLSGNVGAMQVYRRVGFANYQLDPAAGHAQFLQKWLR